MPFKLGLKPPRIDTRTLRMANYFAPSLPEPPEAIDYGAKVKHWPMLLNDQLGDCLIAALLHGIQCQTASANQERVPTDKIAMAGYEAVGGYRPGDPSTDQGCVMLDGMRYLRTHGFGGHKCKAFAGVTPTDQHEVRTACWLLGGVQFGFSLPNAWQNFKDGETWRAPTAPRDRRGRWAANPSNGHAINAIGFDLHDMICVTWGRVQRISHTFVAAYATEAYCVLSDDWISRLTHLAPSGFDTAALETDLRGITA